MRYKQIPHSKVAVIALTLVSMIIRSGSNCYVYHKVLSKHTNASLADLPNNFINHGIIPNLPEH